MALLVLPFLGRPLGTAEFVHNLEQVTGKPLTPKRAGRKPSESKSVYCPRNSAFLFLPRANYESHLQRPLTTFAYYRTLRLSANTFLLPGGWVLLAVNWHSGSYSL